MAERFTAAQALALGRNHALIGLNLRIDRIVELQPVGTNEANIVWQWKFSEHYIQNFDDTKPKYGVVADHPELFDLNVNNGQ